MAEDTMFFPRLRRQAKWMFVFLALVFGLGYVIFNVGGTIPGTGIADLLRGSAVSPDQPSVSDAQERISENPRDATAYHDLARALQIDGRTQEAIPPLERYMRLRPNDTEALQELASLYLVEADRLREEYRVAQGEALIASSGSLFSPGLQPPRGRNAQPPEDPIARALTTRADEQLNRIGTEFQSVSAKAKDAYVKIAARNPNDADVQIQLAQAAESSGDTRTALGAYRRFLRLAPEDPNAPLIRERMKMLQREAGAGAAG